MKQHKRTWQRHEQRVARALGVQRTGNTGAATVDVETPWLAVECKSWRILPANMNVKGKVTHLIEEKCPAS